MTEPISVRIFQNLNFTQRIKLFKSSETVIPGKNKKAFGIGFNVLTRLTISVCKPDIPQRTSVFAMQEVPVSIQAMSNYV